MPKFKYKAVDADGTPKKGVVEADTITAAAVVVLDLGLRVTELDVRRGVLHLQITKKKVKKKTLMSFSGQLAVFLRAGISVIDALEVILEELDDKLMSAAVVDMVEGLRGGMTFADSARSHPEAFPEYYVGVLEAAELTGNLDSVLEELAMYIGRDLDARRKIVSALFYPGCVFLMSLATVGVMAVFVLPKFKKFFGSLHAKLPLPTRALMGVTDIMTKDWLYILLSFAAVFCVLMFGPRTRRGRIIRDRSILKVPVIGQLIRLSILERFCRTMSSMVHAGVSLPDAVEVGSDGTNNIVYRTRLEDVRTAMMEGEGLAGPMARTGLFPAAARQMIRVGEETGTLDRQLDATADYLGRELDHKIGKFVNMFEPAVILFMGVVVGFVAIALVSAMYGIFGQVKA